jgi:hypothetical protein
VCDPKAAEPLAVGDVAPLAACGWDRAPNDLGMKAHMTGLLVVLEVVVVLPLLLRIAIFFANTIFMMIIISPCGVTPCPPCSSSGARRCAPFLPMLLQSWVRLDMSEIVAIISDTQIMVVIMHTTTTQILTRIRAAGRGSVLTPKQFLDIGSRAAVDQTLSRLVRRGVLQRIGRGLYHYPKRSARPGG